MTAARDALGGAQPPGSLLDPRARLWSTNVIYADSSPYVISSAFELRGPYDLQRLRAAVQDLPRRHPELAVAFEMDEGRLLTRADPRARVELEVRADGATAVPALVAATIAGWSWDLGRPPHLRAVLWELGPEHALLVVGVHHVAADAYGFDRMMTGLTVAYNAGAPSGDPLDEAADPDRPLPGGPSPDRAARSRQYWARELAGRPEPLTLPVAGRSAAPRRAGVLLHDEVAVALPAPVGGRRPAPGSTEGTEVTALFGAYLALLAGTDEVSLAFPMPVGTVRRPEQGRAVRDPAASGLGVLRLMVAGADTAGLVRQCQRKVLQGMRHPYGALEAWHAGGEAGASVPTVITQWARGAEDFQPPQAWDGVAVTKVRTPLWTSEFDLDLWVQGRGDRLSVRLGFRPDRVPPEAAAALARGFAVFHAAALAEPERPLAELPLTAAVETADLATDAADPGLDVIGALGEVDPDLPAVITEHGVTNYGQLRDLAGRVAGLLRKHGLGPGSRVAVDVRPGAGPASVAIPYGIWGAGGVYVPLPADAPPARVQHALAAAGAGAVLTDRPGRYPGGPDGLTVLDIADIADAATAPAGTLAPPGPEDPAYVVFTSGSTGLPKAVEARHRNLLAAVRSFQRVLAVPDGARVGQTSAAVFDPSLLELLLAAEVRGTLVVAPEAVRRDPRELARWVDEHRVDVLQATPTVWEGLLPHLAALPHRPAVCCSGGEVLTARLAERILELGGQLWNLYGPSETTIWATAGRCHDADSPPSIGRPLPGVGVDVVNRHGQPLPAGFDGELVITGAGVTAGYRDEPELTAARFGPETPPVRYRSGDLGSRDAAGELHFAGRLDRQTKLAGRRLDPAEVEQVLGGHPDIAGAYAAVRRLPDRADPVLCGWVVATGTGIDREDLLRALRERLPRHAVPAALVELSAFPRTVTGKVDPAALPAPTDEDLLRSHTRLAPTRTPTEHAVRQAFEHVLGVRPVGLLDDFFELGGSSLAALRLSQLLEELLGRETPVSAIYLGSTVGGVAALLDEE